MLLIHNFLQEQGLKQYPQRDTPTRPCFRRPRWMAVSAGTTQCCVRSGVDPMIQSACCSLAGCSQHVAMLPIQDSIQEIVLGNASLVDAAKATLETLFEAGSKEAEGGGCALK